MFKVISGRDLIHVYNQEFIKISDLINSLVEINHNFNLDCTLATIASHDNVISCNDEVIGKLILIRDVDSFKLVVEYI
jgi:hypothetical protein